MPTVVIADPGVEANRQFVGTVPPSPGGGGDPSKGNYALRAARPGQTLFNSGSVAGGAAYDSGVLDTRMLENLTVVAVNGSAVTARTLTFTFYQEDGTTVLHSFTRVLAVSATEKYVVGPAREAAGTLETVTVAAPLDVPPKFRVQVAAAGADPVSVRSWGH